MQCYCLNSSLAFFSYTTAAALTLYHIKVIVLVYPGGQVKFMEQSRIMDREWQLWKVLHLISMTTKTQIPYNTPKQRAVTFKELDSKIPHCKVKKKGEEKINRMVCRARRQEWISDFHFITALGFRALSDTGSCQLCLLVPMTFKNLLFWAIFIHL